MSYYGRIATVLPCLFQQGEAGEIAREEGVDFANADSLRLDFKNILKIDNLWMFQR